MTDKTQNNPIDAIVDARIIEKMLPLAQVVNDLQQRPSGGADEATVKKLVAEMFEARKDELKPRTVTVKYKKADGKETTTKGAHPDTAKVLEYIRCQRATDRNIYIWGEAGTGKTHLSKSLCEIMDLPLYISGTAMTKYDHLGFRLADGTVVRTSFMDAWVNGGLCILDDNDRSEAKAMAALNAATANGDADFSHCGMGRVERHPDCILIVTGNTPMLGNDSKFMAAGKQDAAFRDRFIFHEMKLDPAFELEITPNPDWTSRVQKIRSAVREIGGNVELVVLATMRASFQGAGLFEGKVLNQEEIEEAVIFKGAGEDMKSLVYAKVGKPSTVAGKLINFEQE